MAAEARKVEAVDACPVTEWLGQWIAARCPTASDADIERLGDFIERCAGENLARARGVADGVVYCDACSGAKHVFERGMELPFNDTAVFQRALILNSRAKRVAI